ncbi:MAG: DcrB-related protein [Byssovorax sp.]
MISSSRPGTALYVSNELAFELPAGSFEDLTVHALEAPLPGGHVVGLLVTRAAIPADSGLADAVRAHVEAEARRLAFHHVIERRERLVAGSAAIEVISRWAHRGLTLHAREIHLADSGVRLTFSMTAPADLQAVSDEYFDHLVSTLDLGHR